VFTEGTPSAYNSLIMKPRTNRSRWQLMRSGLFLSLAVLNASPAPSADVPAADDLQIEITKKGLGKEVVITQGAREWFMMIEVTPENTVVVRQEKDHDQYLVDESETHDRPLTAGEVDAAIADYVNSVKTRAKQK
jgi:hypothetical protein